MCKLKTNILLLCLLAFVCFITKAQIITTAIGTGVGGYSGDSLLALSSQLNLPEGGMAMDNQGNIYFCDYSNNRVRKFNAATGLLVNVAGNGISGFSGDGGQAKQARLNGPIAVALDKQGNVYIADYGNYRIRKVTVSTGIITTIAGTGTYAYNGDNIQAISAHLFEPTGIALDTAGNIYFAHLGDMRVRRIDKVTGVITTFAGTGTTGYNSDNIAANTAHLNFPYGLDFDNNNNLYIADKTNYRIRKVTMTTSLITTVAGNGVYGNGGDGGLATSANLKDPWDVDVDSVGNIYVADRFDNKVRKVSAGNINLFAGTGTAGYSGDNGLATSAMLNACSGVVASKCGAVFIVDRTNSRIRKVSAYNFSATSANILCFAACTGSIGSSASGGQSPYSISWSALGPMPNHLNVCAGNYVGTCIDGNGCTENLYVSITQPSQFSISAITQTNVTCNTNGAAYPSYNGGAGGPYTYTWSGSTSTTGIATNFAPGVHALTMADANGCVATKTFNILFTPTLNLIVNVTDVICGSLGSASATATGAAPFTYSWTSSASTNSYISSLNVGNYSVTVTDANGCIHTKAYAIALQTPSFASVPICFITVDSISQHNVITWDKTLFANADSFYIYRETGTNVYKKIHAQPYSDLSQFVDTVKTLYFPNTGNPNVGTYRYKIKTTDSCGNFSNYSPYHNTLFLVNNNGTFSWSQLYSIEGDPNPVLSYVLERDDLSIGNWVAVGSVAGTQNFIIDPNYSNFVNTASWRIKTQWNINCIASQKFNDGSSLPSASYSNKVTNNPVVLKESKLDNIVYLFPNPSKGIVYMKFVNASINDINSIEVVNVIGQRIYYDTEGACQINISGNSKGVYFVKINIGGKTIFKKVVIED